MGLNTPAIIINDRLHELEGAPDAGKRIGRAVRNHDSDRPDYSSESIGVKVIQCGHSSGIQIVAVGGNAIRALGWSNDCHDDDEKLLRKLADAMGFRVVRKAALNPPNEGETR